MHLTSPGTLLQAGLPSVESFVEVEEVRVKQNSAFPIGFGVTMEGGEAKNDQHGENFKYKMG